ncbi:MAG: hypothetical protein H6585_05100 [Flavobacteriales bacterium]|nr:hypothetical protein [Flavobacteriales bacterium]MCB9447705.1 hypothetical protein [Flavobacteriales bacterium]
MKKKHLQLILSGLFISGSLFLASCGGGHDESEGDGTTTEEHAGTGEEADHHDHGNADYDDAAGVYVCPMKCEGNKTYAEAGKCPACGMDLVLSKDQAKESEETNM